MFSFYFLFYFFRKPFGLIWSSLFIKPSGWRNRPAQIPPERGLRKELRRRYQQPQRTRNCWMGFAQQMIIRTRSLLCIHDSWESHQKNGICDYENIEKSWKYKNQRIKGQSCNLQRRNCLSHKNKMVPKG